MKYILRFLIITVVAITAFRSDNGIADPANYLNDIKTELNKKWPENRTIKLAFHGHSVPAGYYKTPVVKPFGAYPLMLLKELKEIYPYAVISIINTSIGGENAVSGAERFDRDVLVHKPDVLFIDYSQDAASHFRIIQKLLTFPETGTFNWIRITQGWTRNGLMMISAIR